jgi:beta-lactamase class A
LSSGIKVWTPTVVGACLLVAALSPTADSAALSRSSAAKPLVRRGSVVAARRFAARRGGLVAFAVLTGTTRVRGLRSKVLFPSASVVKAMLLVAELRAVGRGHLPASERRLLEPMIEQSDNDAAIAIFGQVGHDGLMRVARAAGMKRFSVEHLFDAQIDAADQARFMLHIERHIPAAHRHYALRLLRSIVSYQRWGIAPVARKKHLKIFFKGGWRNGIVHQVAQLRSGRRRLALAVLTSGESQAYGQKTIEGIAARLLR